MQKQARVVFGVIYSDQERAKLSQLRAEAVEPCGAWAELGGVERKAKMGPRVNKALFRVLQ